jgi:hypothetical protein
MAEWCYVHGTTQPSSSHSTNTWTSALRFVVAAPPQDVSYMHVMSTFGSRYADVSMSRLRISSA